MLSERMEFTEAQNEVAEVTEIVKNFSIKKEDRDSFQSGANSISLKKYDSNEDLRIDSIHSGQGYAEK